MNEKRKEIYRKYYEKNRERILEKSKNASDEEKERRREWQREYYHAHKAEIAEKRQAEKDKWQQYQYEYYQKRKLKAKGEIVDDPPKVRKPYRSRQDGPWSPEGVIMNRRKDGNYGENGIPMLRRRKIKEQGDFEDVKGEDNAESK